MADIRFWSKSLITELLQIYKSHPCLWKIKSEEYKNKKLKESAYNSLVNFCKNNGMHEANRDFVVKKIQSFKGSFRKELKKVADSQRSGGIYKPNLWYYDLLLFTKDQEAPTDSITYIDEQEYDEFYNGDDIHQVQSEESDEQNEDCEPTPRKKRKAASYAQEDFLKVCADTIKANSVELSEFDAVGINAAKKMARMDPIQAIYAESIINSVLRKGLLKQLTEDTSLCDACNRP